MAHFKIPVAKPSMPSQQSIMEHAQSLWETRWITAGGPLVQHFQSELETKLKSPHVVVYSNGHLALESALIALDLGEGEAITSPFTYISTSQAIVRAGLTPIFCDIRPDTCCIDEEKIEVLITSKTKVIVPIHVYGFPCNHEKIQKIADKHGLKVVYDAAHTFGMEVNGQGIATLGDASMFSFHATKVFHTVEGGAVACNDKTLRKKLISAKNFGFCDQDVYSIGTNAKMTELHAAVGLANLPQLDQQIAHRKVLIQHYCKRLKNQDGIDIFSWDNPGIIYNYSYFPVLFSRFCKDACADILEELSTEFAIQSRRYFYPITSDFTFFREKSTWKPTPIAQDISSRVMALPLFAELSLHEVDEVCDALLTLVNRRKET